MSEIKILLKLWTNTYIHICLRPWFWFKGALTYMTDSIVKLQKITYCVKPMGASNRVEEGPGRMNTDWIIPALSVWDTSLVAGTLQGDISACGSGAVCARHSWFCSGHPVHQNWPRQESVVLLQNLLKKGQNPPGKRNMRCRREFQGRRDSSAGAKEKQEAHLGRRSREQGLSRKGGEKGDARPGGGVWGGAGMKTFLNRTSEKAQEKVSHP